jgi:PKD repeat protein
VLAFAPSAATVCPGTTVILSDSSQSAPTSWQWTISPSAGVTFVNGTSATSQNPQVQFANLGTYSVTLNASNSYGSGTAVTQTNVITVTNGRALAFSENFSNAPGTFPPAGWRVVNPSSNFTWQLSPTAVMGPDNVSRRLPMVNDYDDALRGAEDFLITPPLNLGGSTNPELTFAVAYQPYNATTNDGLRVDISTDCGATFRPSGYLKRGLTLATVPTFNTARFAPSSAAQWRRETVDLRPFLTAGVPATQAQTVVVRFVNLNDYGNNVYLANVGVAERVASAAVTGLNASAVLKAFPVPFGSRLHVSLQASVAGPSSLQLFDVLGREVRQQLVQLRPGAQQVELHTEALPSGVYTLRLNSSAGSQQIKVVK